MQITRHGIISTNFYLFKPSALQHLSIWPTLATLNVDPKVMHELLSMIRSSFIVISVTNKVEIKN